MDTAIFLQLGETRNGFPRHCQTTWVSPVTLPEVKRMKYPDRSQKVKTTIYIEILLGRYYQFQFQQISQWALVSQHPPQGTPPTKDICIQLLQQIWERNVWRQCGHWTALVSSNVPSLLNPGPQRKFRWNAIPKNKTRSPSVPNLFNDISCSVESSKHVAKYTNSLPIPPWIQHANCWLLW